MRYARRSMEHSGLPYPVIIIIILFIWCGLITYRLVNRFIFNNNPRLDKEPKIKSDNASVATSTTTIVEPSELLKECPKCGTNLPLNELFCAECGEKLMLGKASRQDIPHSEKTPEKEPAAEPANTPVTALANTIDKPSEALKECPKCGTNLPLNALFCAECGEKLMSGEASRQDIPHSEETPEKEPASEPANAPVTALTNTIDILSETLKECSKCGTNLPLNALFCAKCGERLEPLEVPELDMHKSKEGQEKGAVSQSDNAPVIASANIIDESSDKLKICPKCGMNLPPYSVFCAKCGERLDSQEAPEQEISQLEEEKEKEPISKYDNVSDATSVNASDEPSKSRKECPKYGTDLPLDAMFCAKCGMHFLTEQFLEENNNSYEDITETNHLVNKQAKMANSELTEMPTIAIENKAFNTCEENSSSDKLEPQNKQSENCDVRQTYMFPKNKHRAFYIVSCVLFLIVTICGMTYWFYYRPYLNVNSNTDTANILETKRPQNKDNNQADQRNANEGDNVLIEPIRKTDPVIAHENKMDIAIVSQPKEDEKEQKAETNGGDNEIIEPQKQAEEVIAHDNKTEIAVVSQPKEDSNEQKAKTNGDDYEIIEPLQMEDETVAHEGKTEIVVATQPKEDAKEQKAETKEDDNEIIEPLQMEDETVAHDGKTEIVVTTQQKEDKREQKAETKEANIEIIEPSQQANEVIAHDDRRKIAIPEQILQEIVGQKVKTSEDDDVSIKPSKQAKITIVQDEKNKHVSLEQLKEDIQDKIEDKEVSTYNQELPKQEDITIPQDNGTEVTTIQIQQIPNIIPINTENGTENEAVSKFQHNENETNKIGKDEQSIDELQKEKTIQQLSYIDSLIKKAENGDVNASFELGLLYESGKGTKKNFEQAFKWYSVVAKRGMSNAQVKVGDMYLNGIGVEKNQKNAVEWYRRAANKDNAQGLYSLGLCYEKGLGLSINYNEAIKLYNEAILLGSLDAQYQLAQCYFKGHGVRKDNHNALDKLKKAASKGHVKSQLAIGKCYSEGKGVVQDAKTAVIWYRKAAEKGDAEGQMQLALCYEKGKGVKQNSVIAVEWAEKAAVQGFTAAEYFLGNAYQNGRGVPQDSDIATLWYRKAANKGGHNVANALQMLEQ